MRERRTPVWILALSLAMSFSSPASPESGTPLSRFLAAQAPAVVFISSTQSCANGLSGGPFDGSGFVVSRQGFVLTAAHVVDGIARGQQSPPRPVVCAGVKYRHLGTLGSSVGVPRELRLVAIDDARDLALLQFATVDDYRTFQVASSEGMQSAEEILGLGFPIGSEAVVPARGSITDQTRPDKRWLVNAAVNPGDSGGPVVRCDGKVIGVVNAGIEGAVLMNLIVPLKSNDPLVAQARISQDLSPWLPSAGQSVPDRNDFSDIPREGSCDDRRSSFERPDRGVHWLCVEKDIENGVRPNVHILDSVAVTVPASAAILDVRYFHRTRGDSRSPDPKGPWHANAPAADLQWMKMGKATVTTTGTGDRLVSSVCDNWSAELYMYCGIGVQYLSDARLW